MATRKKPLITANMVTAARLLAMPLLPWLAYEGSPQNPTPWHWVLVVGLIVGSTDYLDGYLARKHGPTVLGGLLDPIADKVIIAAFYLPLMVLEIIPIAATTLLFVREFLVTSLRSVFALRGLTMKTSYLAKIKTWVQMQGIALLLMLVIFDKTLMLSILGVATGGPLLATIIISYKRQKLFVSGAWMTGLTAILTALYISLPLQPAIHSVLYLITAITWLSGADYLLVGFPQIRRSKDSSLADTARIFGALALPCTVTWALIATQARWLPIFILSIELAVGGLDNLTCHHKKPAAPLLWALRTLGVSTLCTIATLIVDSEYDHAVLPIMQGATLLSLLGASYEFWRGRQYYLNEAFRETRY